LGFDPSYPLANLRLGQVGQLAGDPSSDWRPPLEVALRGTRQLGPDQRTLATALHALADRRYPAACQEFSSLIARDSLDVRAWFGLGDCQAQDDAVIPDSRSPSRYRFRSSSEGAIRAYRRALEVVPLAHVAYGGFAISRLSNRLFAEPNQLRYGRLISDTAQVYGAYPALEHDTLVVIPYPFGRVLEGVHTPQTREAATNRSRGLLLQITRGWITAYPKSLPARRGHALALELARRVDAPQGGDPGALEIVNAMRSESATARQDLELGAWALRLLVKANRFGDARALADSMLQVRPANDEQGQIQAGIAALLGQRQKAADLVAEFAAAARLYDEFGKPIDAPIEIRSLAQRLLLCASFGEPADSITTILGRLDAALNRLVPRDQRERVRAAATFQSSLLGFPVLDPPAGSLIEVRVERALLRKNLPEAREALAELAALRRRQVPGTVTFEGVALEARLRLMVGDSAGAKVTVIEALTNLLAQGTDFVLQVPQAASLGRLGDLGKTLDLVEPLARSTVEGLEGLRRDRTRSD
jgi:tetratricopeptide (TPR) repeat protein